MRCEAKTSRAVSCTGLVQRTNGEFLTKQIAKCVSPKSITFGLGITLMLICLEDGTALEGESFGATVDAEGEVVFNTGMVGYSEGLTDPSYRGQILVLTYPLVGNYGVPFKNSKLKIRNSNQLARYPFESEQIQIAGLVVSEYSQKYSHPQAIQSIAKWLKSEGIPAIEGIDTRTLTQKLREKGTMLGRISKLQIKNYELRGVKFHDPNKRNLVAEVSCKEPIVYEPLLQATSYKLQATILLYDCGVKLNIIRNLLKRGCRVIRVPWNFKLTNYELPARLASQREAGRRITNYGKIRINGIVISNGPGDPAKCDETIEQIRKQLVMSNSSFAIPILGICLGNQILALAAGAKTYKLKYGHRSQNQPVIDELQNQAYVTTQNHGFAVNTNTLPSDWEPWFTNLNDGTNEGIRHKQKPWMSVQFHPEAQPGPTDTNWVFDEWLKMV